MLTGAIKFLPVYRTVNTQRTKYPKVAIQAGRIPFGLQTMLTNKAATTLAQPPGPRLYSSPRTTSAKYAGKGYEAGAQIAAAVALPVQYRI
jgi:hypothetical protein